MMDFCLFLFLHFVCFGVFCVVVLCNLENNDSFCKLNSIDFAYLRF